MKRFVRLGCVIIFAASCAIASFVAVQEFQEIAFEAV